MTEQSRNQTPPTAPRGGLALFEQMSATVKASEETKRHLSSQLHRYAEAYAKLKAQHEKLSAAHEIQSNELAQVKASKAILVDANRRQTAELQFYESQLQVFSAEVVSIDAQLRDCDNLVSSVFDISDEGQKAMTMDCDLEQSINAYSVEPPSPSTSPSLASYAAGLILPETPVAFPVSDLESDASITDADFNLDMDAIARDIAQATDKAA